jgi:hypothetical protein
LDGAGKRSAKGHTMTGNDTVADRDTHRTAERLPGIARDKRELKRDAEARAEGRGTDAYGCVDWFDYPPEPQREVRPQHRRDR